MSDIIKVYQRFVSSHSFASEVMFYSNIFRYKVCPASFQNKLSFILSNYFELFSL